MTRDHMVSRSVAIVWIAVVLAVLGGFYYALHPSARAYDAPRAVASRNELTVGDQRPAEALPVFKAAQGGTFTLIIRSDRPGELDVHGYEKKIDLRPDGEVALTFLVNEPGVFPVHLHTPLGPPAPEGLMNHRQLATIEVQPK